MNKSAAAACCALSCPKTCAPQLHAGEQRRRGRNRFPAPELPRKAACGPSSVTPSSAGGSLDICNSSRCALDATAQTAFRSQTAMAFSQHPLPIRGPSLALPWKLSTLSPAKLPSVRTGLSLFHRWETGVVRLQHDFAVGWVWQG